MTELNHTQIDAVAGGSLNDVYTIGAAAVAGAIVGSPGGPVGSLAMAASFALHAGVYALLD